MIKISFAENESIEPSDQLLNDDLVRLKDNDISQEMLKAADEVTVNRDEINPNNKPNNLSSQRQTIFKQT